jgi:hypothetical protein
MLEFTIHYSKFTIPPQAASRVAATHPPWRSWRLGVLKRISRKDAKLGSEII